MKTAFYGLGLATVVISAGAVHYDVASCVELESIDDTTVTSLTIISTPFECDSYMRFRVRNDMTMKSDSAVVFTNFALKVLGTLIVEPDVTFQNITEQETNGGALYVDRDASANFLGTTRFLRNSVISTWNEVNDGGAIYNKGKLAFEGDATFRNNEALTELSTHYARGGAIYNAEFGTVTFNADLTATESRAEGFFEGNGGAIYTNGDIVVQGKSTFTDNDSAEGGSIFISKIGTMTFHDFATFTHNEAYDFRGGAICSYGSLNLMGGSFFHDNYASGFGDGGSGGAIYNGEHAFLSFGGDNTFDANGAVYGGAIFNEPGGSISSPHDSGELVFQKLRGKVAFPGRLDMKTAFFALGLAAVTSSVKGIDYEVASCAELKDIDDTTVTSVTITSTPFECDSYTRFRVRNSMVLKSDSPVEFTNFALKVLGTLTVEPDVTFQDVTEQTTNGGALYVDRGSSATFLGTARFLHNSVTSSWYTGRDDLYEVNDGGAVYNKGELVFDGDVTFSKNEALTELSTQRARGGAIYNAKFGAITFNADLAVAEGRADGFFEGNGGAIYTNGEIVVEGKSTFTDNDSAEGGSIFISKIGTITFNDFSTFTHNTAYDFRGGAICNYGTLNLMGGSLFHDNYASGSGDAGSGGGIYNGEDAYLSFSGDNTFDSNGALDGGAIYNDPDGSISFPQDGGELIFQNLRGEFCPAIFYDLEGSNNYTCGP